MIASVDRDVLLPTVRELYTRLARDLDSPTPAFTKVLAPGLGFAQHPQGGPSFGMSRSRLVAEALVRGYELGSDTAEDRLTALRRAFAAEGLDLDAPHLGPNPQPDADLELAGVAAAAPRRRRQGTDCLDIAATIGRRLCDGAVWSHDRCTWLGPRPNPRPGGWLEVPLASVGPGIYEGTAGIALFLA